MEMRRAEDGMRFWIAEPGEYHMSYSGELLSEVLSEVLEMKWLLHFNLSLTRT